MSTFAIVVLSLIALAAAAFLIACLAELNRCKRALEDISHYLDGVEGKLLHDEWRISQARKSAERALCKMR